MLPTNPIASSSTTRQYVPFEVRQRETNRLNEILACYRANLEGLERSEDAARQIRTYDEFTKSFIQSALKRQERQFQLIKENRDYIQQRYKQVQEQLDTYLASTTAFPSHNNLN